MDIYRCQTVDGPLNATIKLPGSKSLTNRALMIAALADGTSLLRDILLADDTHLMIKALQTLGIAITLDEDSCTAEVTGCGGLLPSQDAQLTCGNAGTVMRFGAALCALGHGHFELDGSPRMRERPIGPLVDLLRSLGTGIEFQQREGYPPVVIHAQGLAGGDCSIPAPESSQFISAVLMVAPYATRDVKLEMRGVMPSVPYLKMTASVMEHFGVTVLEQYEPELTHFIVESSQRYRAVTMDIEPDASNATYFLAAAALLGGKVTVKGLGADSQQGDTSFVDVLKQMGCHVQRSAHSFTLQGPHGDQRLQGLDIDLSDMPDTVQTLAVLALFAEGPTTIRNVANLRVKETDRLAALTTELTKMGAAVIEQSDGLTIHPPDTLQPATIDTYQDHRMAMSFALAGLKAPGLAINNPQCCQKTFPDFFQRFEDMTSST